MSCWLKTMIDGIISPHPLIKAGNQEYTCPKRSQKPLNCYLMVNLPYLLHTTDCISFLWQQKYPQRNGPSSCMCVFTIPSNYAYKMSSSYIPSIGTNLAYYGALCCMSFF